MSEPQALTVADYKLLGEALQSPDESVRTQAQAFSKKLTPVEQQAFFQIQKSQRGPVDLNARADDASPYLMAAAGGMGLARTAAGVMAAPVASRAGAAVSATKDLVGSYAKFKLIKGGLEHMGVPSVLAEPAALALSGYKSGGKTATAEPATGASVREAVDADPRLASMRANRDAGRTMSPLDLTRSLKEPPPATAPTSAAPETSVARGTPVPPDPPPPATPVESPASPTAPSVDSTTSPRFYPQKALNELAIAARRAKVQLSDDQYVTAVEAVKQGATPAEAVAAVKIDAPPKLKISGDESKLYVTLRRQGKTDAEVWEAIQQARILRDHFGLKTPTVEETKFPKGMRGGSQPLKPLP